ncbi:dipeptide epimerase [uncultured Desulfobacter sp.]|uniref:mandelate racemase/muconate lactonizing enzyme family protein n=1 Tax=uncultured Desulfobacter sp. TaxID=240139 RepID=UPI002AABFADE|nr:dipeptide epimerase [uncultured Desulfobacter sp.]
MKITSIEIFKSAIKTVEPFRIAIAVIEHSFNLFIKIHTDEGIYGMGEAAPFWAVTGETQATALAAAKDLAGMLVGEDPLKIREHNQALHRYLVYNSAVRSGFDMALYDLLGKKAGLPVYALLGGNRRCFSTDCTIGIDTPEAMAQKAAALKSQGFNVLKIKLGQTMAQDLARIRAVRQAIGPDIPLRVDANQGWDYPTAAAMLRQFGALGVEYCEQPLAAWDYDNMKRLRDNSDIPIAADESVFDHHDAFKLAAAGCCDILNIKLAKSGGIYRAQQINSVAESAGLKCMLGCMLESRLALTAAAHLVSARPNIKFVDLDGHWGLLDDPVQGGVQYKGPQVSVPDGPGLGADIDPTFLKTCQSLEIKDE